VQTIPFEDHFHVDKRTMTRLLNLALKHGAEFAELYFEYRIGR
jgi:hypothetical protein